MAYIIKAGDRLPSISATLTDADGAAEDLTTASTVVFKWWPKNSRAAASSGSATIVSAADGTVRYDWASSETDTAGDYYALWLVTWTGGKEQTYPADGYSSFTIAPDNPS